ncbi:MAG: transcriptional regulator [Methanobacteriota archaeon]
MKIKKYVFNLSNVIEELNLLKRHIIILKTLRKNEPLGIVKLSRLTKYPGHLVRYSLSELEKRGMIKPSSKGALTTDSVDNNLVLLEKQLKEIKKEINKVMMILR